MACKERVLGHAAGGVWLRSRGDGPGLGHAAWLAAGAALVWHAASGPDGFARVIREARSGS